MKKKRHLDGVWSSGGVSCTYMIPLFYEALIAYDFQQKGKDTQHERILIAT